MSIERWLLLVLGLMFFASASSGWWQPRLTGGYRLKALHPLLLDLLREFKSESMYQPMLHAQVASLMIRLDDLKIPHPTLNDPLIPDWFLFIFVLSVRADTGDIKQAQNIFADMSIHFTQERESP